MILLPFIGFVIIIIGNLLSSKFGFFNLKNGDKDILFPFSSMIFLFFSLLIYLPQIHGKITKLSDDQTNNSTSQMAEEQEQLFPIGFLFGLLSISLAILMDKFCLHKIQQTQEQDQRKLHDHKSQHENNRQNSHEQSTTLKYFLTLSVSFINLSNAYFITVESRESSVLAELLVFCIFNLVLNFSYGYLLAWAQVEQQLVKKLFVFTNISIFVGFILGLILKITIAIVVLPCISVGCALYSAAFLCMPKIFTNGQKPVQDKFRYWSIFTALLLTIIYYPIIYLLKI